MSLFIVIFFKKIFVLERIKNKQIRVHFTFYNDSSPASSLSLSSRTWMFHKYHYNVPLIHPQFKDWPLRYENDNRSCLQFHLPRDMLLIHVMHWINELVYYYAKVCIIGITPYKIWNILFTAYHRSFANWWSIWSANKICYIFSTARIQSPFFSLLSGLLQLFSRFLFLKLTFFIKIVKICDQTVKYY